MEGTGRAVLAGVDDKGIAGGEGFAAVGDGIGIDKPLGKRGEPKIIAPLEKALDPMAI